MLFTLTSRARGGPSEGRASTERGAGKNATREEGGISRGAGTNQTRAHGGRQHADTHARRRRGIRLDVRNNELAITICSSDRTGHVQPDLIFATTQHYATDLMHSLWASCCHARQHSHPHGQATHYSVVDRLYPHRPMNSSSSFGPRDPYG